jgi:hypothetical protein
MRKEFDLSLTAREVNLGAGIPNCFAKELFLSGRDFKCRPKWR